MIGLSFGLLMKGSSSIIYIKRCLTEIAYINSIGITYEMIDIITPAQSTPSVMGTIVSFNFMRMQEATNAPVQPPVPGKGTATKIKRPHLLCFSIVALFAIAFFSKWVKI